MEKFETEMTCLEMLGKWSQVVRLFEKQAQIKDVDYRLSIVFIFACFKSKLRIPKALSLCEEIELRVGVSEGVRQNAIQNHSLFLEKLRCTVLVELKPELEEGFDGHNPCPFWRDHQLCVVIRKTGYVGKQFTTRNCLLTLDQYYQPVSQEEIVIATLPTRKVYNKYDTTGVEDIRISGDQITATSYDFLDDENPQMIRGRLVGNVIQDIVPLKTSSTTWEKNWMPLLEKNKYIYKTSPFTVLESDKQGQCWVNDRVYDTKFNCDGFRGSTNVLEWEDDSYICMIHQVQPSGARIYMQRFLVFDKNYNVTAVSKAFYLVHRGIEFVTGMVRSKKGKAFIIGVGIKDEQGFLVQVTHTTVRKILKVI